MAAQKKDQKKDMISRASPRQMKRINLLAKVAAELFSTQGYTDTTIDDIAAAARATKGGIYHYFTSKTEILYFICSTYVDLDVEGLYNSSKEIDDPVEKIHFIITRHIDHYSTHAFAAKTLIHEAYNLPPKYSREVKARERRYYEILTEVVSEFLGAHSRKELATTLTFTLFGMLNWIYTWYDPRGPVKPRDLSQLIFELFTNGVRHSILK